MSSAMRLSLALIAVSALALFGALYLGPVPLAHPFAGDDQPVVTPRLTPRATPYARGRY